MKKQRLNANLEQKSEAGTGVPGYSLELGTRISSIIDEIGSLKVASEAVGCTSEQLAKWRDGKAKMPLYAAQSLCEATNKSLDWLLYGSNKGASVSGIDPRIIYNIAYFLADKTELIAADPTKFAEYFTDLATFFAEEGRDVASIENVIEFDQARRKR